jgi:uncharacterized protein (UPF0548 family)
MFFAGRPSLQVIVRFGARALELPLSYSPIGIAHDPSEANTKGYDIDGIVVRLGSGKACFDRAKAALAEWRHFDLGWVEVFPKHASLDPGTVVTVLVRHLGFWSLNGCRVVYGTGDQLTGFGFAYGTLVSHAESGEESFEVRLDPETAEVTYRIRATSRPRAVLARLGYPIVRALQTRFRRDSAEAMRRATEGTGPRN